MRRFIRNGLVAAIALVATAHATVVSDHGRLKIQNNRVVDSLGRPTQLGGMSLYWSIWGGEKFFNAQVVQSIVKDWGASVIRAPMAVYTPNSTPSYLYNDANKTLIKTVVQAAIDNGIYVIIDWHVEGDSPSESQAKTFFSEMAQTYGSTPNVIFEVWNEPTTSSWSTVKTYAQNVLAEIRKYSQNLVIVGSPQWSAKVDLAAADPINDPNVAYTFHFYSCTHTAAARAVVQQASSKIPIFFTEWGTSASNGSGSICTGEADQWLSLAKNLGISWANWSLSNKNESSAALVTSAGTTGGWSDNQLSPSGTYVKAKILEVAAALKVTAAVQAKAESVSWGSGLTARYDGKSLAIEVPAGTRSVSIRDLAGHILAHRGATEGSVLVPLDARGLVLVQANGDHGSSAIGVVIAR